MARKVPAYLLAPTFIAGLGLSAAQEALLPPAQAAVVEERCEEITESVTEAQFAAATQAQLARFLCNRFEARYGLAADECVIGDLAWWKVDLEETVRYPDDNGNGISDTIRLKGSVCGTFSTNFGAPQE